MRLLDQFCGAGGAARGYHDAGFEVVGVDSAPQPHYPYPFIQADALTFPLDGFDVIHASPPCQGYSCMRYLPWLRERRYPLLIGAVYDRLTASGLPFLIENSERAPMPGGVVLCGSMFGLEVLRHRAFWSNVLLLKPGPCRHTGRELIFRETTAETHYRDAMQIDWMTAREARQAIPPAYTRWLGRQLAQVVRSAAYPGRNGVHTTCTERAQSVRNTCGTQDVVRGVS